MALTLPIRAAASSEPRTSDPRSSIQDSGAGVRRPETATRKLLLRLSNDAREGRPLRLAAAPPVSPGTVLMRNWQGTIHEVKVINGGVSYKGKRYRSLSEVARLITGARWNGPLFFGLRGKSREEACRASK